MERTNKHGIDMDLLSINLIEIIKCEPRDTRKKFDELVFFIELQIKSKMTTNQKITFAASLAYFIFSKPATNERLESLQVILNAEFLDND